MKFKLESFDLESNLFELGSVLECFIVLELPFRLGLRCLEEDPEELDESEELEDPEELDESEEHEEPELEELDPDDLEDREDLVVLEDLEDLDESEDLDDLDDLELLCSSNCSVVIGPAIPQRWW